MLSFGGAMDVPVSSIPNLTLIDKLITSSRADLLVLELSSTHTPVNKLGQDSVKQEIRQRA